MASNPIESIIFLVSVVMFGFFLYFVSPLYAATYTSVLTVSVTQRLLEYILGVFFMATTLPGLFVPFIKSNVLARWSTTLLMMNCMFLVTIRWLVVGIFPLTWLGTFIIALILLILRIYLGDYEK